jgi:hypothetical protein
MFDVVVISRYRLGPLQVRRADIIEESFLNQQRDLSPVLFGKPARQPRVPEICSADIFP